MSNLPELTNLSPPLALRRERDARRAVECAQLAERMEKLINTPNDNSRVLSLIWRGDFELCVVEHVGDAYRKLGWLVEVTNTNLVLTEPPQQAQAPEEPELSPAFEATHKKTAPRFYVCKADEVPEGAKAEYTSTTMDAKSWCSQYNATPPTLEFQPYGYKRDSYSSFAIVDRESIPKVPEPVDPSSTDDIPF